MTDDSHCDSIRSSLTAVHGYVGKQPVDMEEYCEEYCLKERQESMDRCTGHGDIPEILLKMTLNTLQSINQSTKPYAAKCRLTTLIRKRHFENIVGIGENAGYQHFLLFRTMSPPPPQKKKRQILCFDCH